MLKTFNAVSAVRNTLSNPNFEYIDAGGGRLVIHDKESGQVLGMNLGVARYPGPAGAVLTVGSVRKTSATAYAPAVHANIKRGASPEENLINWSGKTSVGMLSDVVSLSLEHAKATGQEWQSVFHKFSSEGSAKYGLPAQITLPHNAPEDVKLRAYQQVHLTMSSYGPDVKTKSGIAAPTLAEQAAVYHNLEEHILAADKKPLEGAFPLPQEPVMPGETTGFGGNTGLSFADLNRFKVRLNEKGRLQTSTINPLGGDVGDVTFLSRNAGKFVKNPLGSSGQNTVQPFDLIRVGTNRLYQPVVPGVITDQSRPTYAYPNVISPTGENQPGTFMSIVVAPTGIPGAAIAYDNPARPQYREGQWGERPIPLGEYNVADVASGKIDIKLDDIIGKTFGAGRTTAPVVGSLTRGETTEPIRMRVSANEFTAQNISLTMPKWKDKQGMPVADYVEGRGIVSTDAEAAMLRERYAMPVEQVSGTTFQFNVGGVSFGDVSEKGFGFKQALMRTGKQAFVHAGGLELPVDRFTAEVKNASMLQQRGFSPSQMAGWFSDFAANSYQEGVSGTAEARLEQFYRGQYAQADPRRPLGVNMELLAEKYKEFSGGEFQGNGEQLASLMYERNVHQFEPGSPENRRNLEIYGMGKLGRQNIPMSAWSPDNISMMREMFKRNMQAQNPSITEADVTAAFNERFTGTSTLTGAKQLFDENFGSNPENWTELERRLPRGAEYFGNVFHHSRMEYANKNVMDFMFASGASRAFPELSKELGVSTDVFGGSRDPKVLALAGGFRFASMQNELMRNSEAYGPLSSEIRGVRQISDEEAAKMAGYIRSMENAPAEEILSGLSKQFGREDENQSSLWQFETGGALMPHPSMGKQMDFTELGINSRAFSKTWLSSFNRAYGVISNEEQRNVEGEGEIRASMNRAVMPLYSMMRRRILSTGNYVKRMLSQRAPTEISNRSIFDPLTQANEITHGSWEAKRLFRQMGQMPAGEEFRRLVDEGYLAIGGRHPMSAEGAVYGYQNPGRRELVRRLGGDEARYRRIYEGLNSGSATGISLADAVTTAGDFDRDQKMFLAAIKFNAGKLDIFDTPELRNAQLTNQKALDWEAKVFPSTSYRNKVNAIYGSMGDVLENKDIIGGLIKESLTPQNYRDLFSAGAQYLYSKKSGMGSGFNVRLALGAVMRTMGYSEKEFEKTETSFGMPYQTYLDNMLKMQTEGGYSPEARTGIPAANYISGAYFSKNEDTGKLSLRIGGGEFARRGNQVWQGKLLTPLKQNAQYFDLQKLLTSPSEALSFLTYGAQQVMKGVPGPGGKPLGEFSAQQMASLYAGPGEQEELETILKGKDRDEWTDAIGSFKLEKSRAFSASPQMQVEQMLSSTPHVMASFVRAFGKAQPGQDTEDGGERIPGGEEALKMIEKLHPGMYQSLSAATSAFEIENKAKNKGLFWMQPTAIQDAMKTWSRTHYDPAKMKREAAFTKKLSAIGDFLFGGIRMPQTALQRPNEDPDRIPVAWQQEPSAAKETPAKPSTDTESLLIERGGAISHYDEGEFRASSEPIVPEPAETGTRKEDSKVAEDRLAERARRQQEFARRFPAIAEERKERQEGGARTESFGGSKVPRGPSGPGGGGPPPIPGGLSGPNEPPDDDGKSKHSYRTTKDAVYEGARESGEVTSRITGLYHRLLGYEASGRSASTYVGGILDEMGIPAMRHGEEGQEITRSYKQRIEEVMRKSPGEFVLNLARDPVQFKNALSVSEMGRELSLSLATMDNARISPAMQQYIRDVGAGQGTAGRDIHNLRSLSRAVSPDKIKDFGKVSTAIAIERSPQFQAGYAAMEKAGLFSEGAVDEEKVKEFLVSRPEMAHFATQAKNLVGSEASAYLPTNIKRLATWAGSVNAVDKSILKEGAGAGFVSVSPQDVDRLSSAFKNLKDKMSDLHGISEKTSEQKAKEIRLEAQKADIAYRAEAARFQAAGVKQRLEQMHADLYDEEGRPKTIISSADQKEMGRLSKLQTSLESEYAQRRQEQEELEQSGKGGMGRIARRMLGGFGLMYIRSIANLATSGMGYGEQERQALEQSSAQSANQIFGSRITPFNQRLQLQNAMALAGSNYSATTAMQMFGARNPWAREAGGSLVAGIGAYGMASYMASLGPELGFLGPAAIPIGVGIAGANLGLQAYERAQDPASLAFRLSRGGMRGFSFADTAASMMTSRDEGFMNFGGAYDLLTTGKAYKPGSDYDKLQQDIVFNKVLRGNIEAGGYNFADFQRYNPNKTNAQIYSGLVQSYMDAEGGAQYSAEAHQAALGIFAKSPGMRQNLALEQRFAAAYQTGLNPEGTAQTLLSGFGYTAYDQLRLNAQGISTQGALAKSFIEGETLTLAEQETLQAGAKFASTIPGLKRNREVGAAFRAAGRGDKGPITELGERFAKLEGTRAGEVYVQQQQAAEAAQMAGVQYTAPSTTDFFQNGAVREINPLEAAQQISKANAISQISQQRIATAQRWQTQAYSFGNYAMGDRSYQMFQNTPVGSEWLMNRAMSVDPMMMASLSSKGLNLSAMPGLTTLNGTQLNANYAAFSDKNLQGQVTGLQWGTTSFNLGNLTGAQMANNIWGQNWQQNKNFNAGLINAGVNGFALAAPITLPDGSQVSSIGGTMGMGLYQSQLQMNQQLAQVGIQQKGWQQNWDYQHQMWGIEDKERAASIANQRWQFGFQERQIQQNVAQFNETRALDLRQTTAQRGWTREDWGYQDMTRNMQWGWKQEDFQEEARFMTGRQRRLAERSMRRETIMHNLEGDQIEKQRDRQQELWHLEDERFKLQKKYFEQGVQMQEEQLKHAKQYFEQNKKYEDEKIKLSRKHWEEEMKLQKESMAISASYAIQQHQLNVTMAQLEMSTKLTEGQLSTLTDNGMENFKNSLISVQPFLQQVTDQLNAIAQIQPPNTNIITPPVYDWSGTGTGSTTPVKSASNPVSDFLSSYSTPSRATPGEASFIPLAGRKSSSQGQQVINVYVGNEKLASYVIDTVSKEMSLQ